MELPPDICHVMNGAQEIREDVFCNLLCILHPSLQQNQLWKDLTSYISSEFTV